MKKNVLALSISAAIGVIGMVGSAHAIQDLGVVGSVGLATQLKVNNSGIGHNLIVPYFTAQAKNATLLTLTNTTNIGKAVKVRFRGAENSDDVKDFQVFLSPFDVWTANVSQSDTGQAQITTSDKSCTKGGPTSVSNATVNKFGTDRLQTLTSFAGTREGYIEIFNMADIPNTAVAGSLSAAITHAQPAGVPTCAGTGYTFLDTDQVTGAALVGGYLFTPVAANPTGGLALPTTGLTASWIIINTATGAAYGGNATAIQALNGAGAPSTGNLVYWPQTNGFVVGETRGYTADPLLAGNLTAVPPVVPVIKALMQDLPDMSTPYILGLAPLLTGDVKLPASYAAADLWAATSQALLLSRSLAATSVNNEFFSDSASLEIGAATDWVFSMPTRRYNIAVNYGATTADKRIYTNYTLSNTGIAAAGPAAVPAPFVNYFSAANTQQVGTAPQVICVDGIAPAAYNREEGTNSGVTPSPSPASYFCGEAGVWGVNQTIAAGGISSVLSAALTVTGITFTPTPYSEGWMSVATPGLAGIGLPVLGGAFTKVSSNASTNYGWNTDHRVTRAVGYVY